MIHVSNHSPWHLLCSSPIRETVSSENVKIWPYTEGGIVHFVRRCLVPRGPVILVILHIRIGTWVCVCMCFSRYDSPTVYSNTSDCSAFPDVLRNGSTYRLRHSRSNLRSAELWIPLVYKAKLILPCISGVTGSNFRQSVLLTEIEYPPSRENTTSPEVD